MLKCNFGLKFNKTVAGSKLYLRTSPPHSVFVVPWTRFRLSNSGAKVSVYLNNEYKGTYEVKPNQVGLIWNVFEIVNDNEIRVIDKVSNEL